MITPSSMGLQNPGGKTQAELLHSYDVAAHKYAQVPGIRIPKEMIAQQIYGVRVTAIQPRFALVEWKTTKNATSVVEYGTTEACSDGTVQDLNMTQDHSLVIRNLQPATKYYFRAKSVGEDSKEVASGVYNFTTVNETQTIPVEVLMITIPELTNNSATIRWKTSTKATCTFEYCTDNKSFDKTIVVDTLPNIDHEISLTGLKPNTKYYARISAEDIGGQVTKSSIIIIQTESDDENGDGGPTTNTTKKKNFMEEYGLFIAGGVALVIIALLAFFIIRKKKASKTSIEKDDSKVEDVEEKKKGKEKDKEEKIGDNKEKEETQKGSKEVKDVKEKDLKTKKEDVVAHPQSNELSGEAKTLDEKIKKLESEIREAKSRGLDVTEAEGTLNMAKKFFDKKNYNSASRLLSEAEKEIEKIKVKN
jgi:large-conductance mechanosensitive channel